MRCLINIYLQDQQVVSLPAAFSQTTTSANDFRVPSASCHVSSSRYLPHDLLAMHRRMLPPMFPSSFFGGSHKIADPFPMHGLNRQESFKDAKASTPISNVEVGRNKEIGDSSSSTNSSVNNSSFEKHNGSFSETHELDSESEESNEELDVESSTLKNSIQRSSMNNINTSFHGSFHSVLPLDLT